MPRSSLAKVDVAIDTGNPLLDRSVDGFLKIGTVAATRAAAEDAYRFADRGSVSRKNVEQSLKKMCKEGAYWGTVAGVYLGVEYGVSRIRGTYDWFTISNWRSNIARVQLKGDGKHETFLKNAMIGGALTGALVSAVSNGNRDKIVMDALTGGAIATAAEFISYLK